MVDIWFTADLHLGHKNIVKGISEFKNKEVNCRNFNTLEQHDKTILNGINKYVKKNDILYIAGDFSLGGRENVKKYRDKINCLIIHLCLGNHDIHISKNAVLSDNTRTQDLFTSVSTVLDKKIRSKNYVISHYAHRAWHNGAHGSINLHGDAHGNLKPYEKLLHIADEPILYKTEDLYKQFDIGIDVAYQMFREYRPFHITEIEEIMGNRINLNVDHH